MRERRAYWCQKCEKEGRPHRQFQGVGEPVPTCNKHGKMVRLPNAKYHSSMKDARGSKD